jgi:hypothetical protein
MAYVEAAVVVYLREIFYEGGFAFPLLLEPCRTGYVELVREAATLLMLLTVAFLSGQTKWQRFSFFFFTFGVWDIFYYAFLKITIGWPSSLLTWDILFLLPVPWIGPVLAPMILALSMAIMGVLIVRKEDQGRSIRFGLLELLLLIGAGLLPFVSFVLDFQCVLQNEMPRPYHWELLAAGVLLWAVAMIRMLHTGPNK